MRTLRAYLASVAVSALVMVLVLDVDFFHGWDWGMLGFAGFEFLVAFLVSAIFAIAPFHLVRRIALRRGVTSILYYLACGLIVGLAADLAFSGLDSLPLPPGDIGLPFEVGVRRFLVMFVAGGVAGSLSYWLFEGRLGAGAATAAHQARAEV
jgi:hypothetical protein